MARDLGQQLLPERLDRSLHRPETGNNTHLGRQLLTHHIGIAAMPAKPFAQPVADCPSNSLLRRGRLNGCSRDFQRKIVRSFRTVEDLRLALIDFRRTYNECRLVESHGHRSPTQFRRDQMDKLPLAA